MLVQGCSSFLPFASPCLSLAVLCLPFALYSFCEPLHIPIQCWQCPPLRPSYVRSPAWRRVPVPAQDLRELSLSSRTMPWTIVLTSNTGYTRLVSKCVCSGLTVAHPRLDVPSRQIIKERQIEFDIDTDPDTMYELFGEDYLSFAE